jgi:hypothetical protein
MSVDGDARGKCTAKITCCNIQFWVGGKFCGDGALQSHGKTRPFSSLSIIYIIKKSNVTSSGIENFHNSVTRFTSRAGTIERFKTAKTAP